MHITGIVLALLLACSASTSSAEDKSIDSIEGHVLAAGTVERIDPTKLEIVVNDVQMRLAVDARVRSRSEESMELEEIVPGMRVRLSGIPSEVGGSEVISEVIVLSEDEDLPRLESEE